MSGSNPFASLRADIKAYFHTGVTRELSWRKAQIHRVLDLVRQHEAELVAALQEDLHKCRTEAVITELVLIQREAEDLLHNLSEWTKPEALPTPGVLLPASSEIRREPYGVCLIVGPFNYPVQLVFVPLLAAIAAGNCAVIKPSEQCPRTEELVARLIPLYLDQNAVRVVTGAIPEMQALLALQWDFIFFTGSERVGKIVMQAASNYLTPVVLELGGKSPAIVDSSVRDLQLAAKRLTWGKFTNAGQTCIAPDYILCHKNIYDQFLQTMQDTIRSFYGDNPRDAPDYGRIVTDKHTERLESLLKDNPGRIVTGGEVDVSSKYIAPTIIADTRLDSAVMQDEIFGPLLPVLPYSSLNEAIDIINRKPKPLALYVFATDNSVVDTVLNRVQSGGVCVNDTLIHMANCELPFGGIGGSGMGNYHGKFSIDAFSHKRAVLRKDDHSILDVPIRYPPYTAFGENLFRRLAMVLPSIPPVTTKGLMKLFLLAAIIAVLAWAIETKRIVFNP